MTPKEAHTNLGQEKRHCQILRDFIDRIGLSTAIAKISVETSYLMSHPTITIYELVDRELTAASARALLYKFLASGKHGEDSFLNPQLRHTCNGTTYMLEVWRADTHILDMQFHGKNRHLPAFSTDWQTFCPVAPTEQ